MALTGLAAAAMARLPPERAHTLTISALKRGLGVPLGPPNIPAALGVCLPRSGLRFASPIGLAAGFDKNCDVPQAMAQFGFGFLECGTVTPLPQAGNPSPRLFRLRQDRAIINRLGFNNFGLAYFVRRLKAYRGGVPLGANVGANKASTDRIADYVAGIEAVAPYAAYITVNVSSPNTPGLRGLQNKDELTALLTACGRAAHRSKPVFLKVAPDLDAQAISDIVAVTRGAGRWLSGLVVSNTTVVRPDHLASAHKHEPGGLSGAPLMAPSTDILRIFAQELNGEIDLIGAGGIFTAADVRAKLAAGAHAVQLYSAMVYEGPGLAARLNRQLADQSKTTT